MMSFSVTLRGPRKDAVQSEIAVQLAKLLGRSVADAERALAMPSLTVKRGIDLRTANRYQTALDDCGACATIEREFIAESSLDGIPEAFHAFPAVLRHAERIHPTNDKNHAAMVGLLATGDHGSSVHSAMEQNLKDMCGGRISLEGLLRYFNVDRLKAILDDARTTLSIYQRGGYNQVVNYGYGRPSQPSAADSAFYIQAAHCFEAFLVILRDHGVVTPEGELPASVALRDGKGSQIRAKGQRVQFCHRDSPYVHAGTVDGCQTIGVEVVRTVRDGVECSALIPYANLFLDGGDTFRPLPREAVLERRQLTGYALPQVPELRLMGNMEVELDLLATPQTLTHRAFFFDFASKVRDQSGGRLETANLGPGIFLVGGNLELAATAVAQVMEPLRLKS
ncbi:hypothetical protein [Pseudoduganella violaceinigra]|uniref:hypothetical protein n=1 Tax=Pseudoduganella violaceinigra TaxID=246602 RepID=UPI00041B5644|nr:hypothetical protein [Pseudoduganella violaceinigra]